ncbi:MAG: hypothetical protein ACOCZ6_01530 [Nanoarchaeota archaeon]
MLRQLILLIILFGISASAYGSFDPRVDDWYEVEDWEIEICSKWGGTGQAERHSGAVMQTPLHEMATTVQGEYTEYDSEEEGEKTRIYEFSWYLQPIGGQESYTVTAKGDEDFVIADGTAAPAFGDAGYHATEETDVNYTSVVLEYDSGKIEAPIVG